MNASIKRFSMLVAAAGIVATVILLLDHPSELASDLVHTADPSDPTQRLPASDAAASSMAPRPRKHREYPNNREVMDLLKTVSIEKLEMQEVPLIDALETLNQAVTTSSPTADPPKIRWTRSLADSDPQPVVMGLRLRQIPATIALKGMCDQTRCRFWVFKGDVFVEPWNADPESEERFLRETRLKDLTIQSGTLAEALEALNDAAFDADFFGQKPPILLRPDGTTLHDNGGKPVQGLSARNIVIGDAVGALCQQAGMRFEIFEGEIHLIPAGPTPTDE